MKIEQQNIAGTNSSQALSSYGGSSQRTFSPAGSGTDQAEISGLSQAIQSFQNSRSARVSQLTALVRDGKYDVSPALISRSIVGEALNASSNQSGVHR